ncbi:hypothetical protein [Lutimonas vermicola]|uniref:Haem-binding uptake Tiki superfamily ChaN domain-containing protein n=1 Tax=Lutimonas vermicola TaxID=414288 RepID=A0ABU9L4J5_9FLAO
MKILKYLKYIVIVWLILTLLICVGGIIKYNIDLNTYIDHEEPKENRNTNISLSKETEVYVVGSVHFETDNIKRDDIYNYINSISPDVILYESDTNTVERMVNRTDFFNQLMSSFKKGNKVESFVSLKYLDKHPQAMVLGYEWEERDAFHLKHNYRSTSSKMIGAVYNSYRQDLLTGNHLELMDTFAAINKEYYKISRNAKVVYDLNNAKTDSIIRERQFYIYKRVPEIVKARPELADYKDFAPLHMEYWDIRNKAMTANILKQIKRHPNKRIVVLTGNTHRYYLIDELKKYEEEFNFSVK